MRVNNSPIVPYGWSGFLIGRGNLQLSPAVLESIGIDNILGVLTPAKLLTVRKLRIETETRDWMRDSPR